MNLSRRLSLGICAAIAIFADCAIAGPVTMDLQSRTIFGFTTTGQHRITDTYQTGPNGIGTSWTGSVSLLPADVIYERGSAGLPTDFFNVLSTVYPNSAGWSYASGGTELTDGSIQV